MTYKALEDIGEYKKGDLIPDEKGSVWGQMYKVSPVEKVGPDMKESSEPEKKVEDKSVSKEKGKKKSSSAFRSQLSSIKGIGSKTVDDIIVMFPDEESLRDAIEKDKPIPFRDDIADKLIKEFS